MITRSSPGPGCGGRQVPAPTPAPRIPATRAQCSGGAPCGRCAGGRGGGGQLVRLRAGGGSGGLCRAVALRAVVGAMAHPGKLLKEQKYDRQLRLAGAHQAGRAGQ